MPRLEGLVDKDSSLMSGIACPGQSTGRQDVAAHRAIATEGVWDRAWTINGQNGRCGSAMKNRSCRR